MSLFFLFFTSSGPQHTLIENQPMISIYYRAGRDQINAFLIRLCLNSAGSSGGAVAVEVRFRLTQLYLKPLYLRPPASPSVAVSSFLSPLCVAAFWPL